MFSGDSGLTPEGKLPVTDGVSPKFKLSNSIDEIIPHLNSMVAAVNRIKLYEEQKFENKEILKEREYAIKICIGLFFENAFKLYDIFERSNVEKTQIFESFHFDAFKDIRNEISHQINKISNDDFENIKTNLLSLEECFNLTKSKALAIKKDKKTDTSFILKDDEKNNLQEIKNIGERYKQKNDEKKITKKSTNLLEQTTESEIKLIHRRLEALNSIENEIKNIENFMQKFENFDEIGKKISIDACKMSLFYIGFWVKDKLTIKWTDENIMKGCSINARNFSDTKNNCMHAGIEFKPEKTQSMCHKILNSNFFKNIKSCIIELEISQKTLLEVQENTMREDTLYTKNIHIDKVAGEKPLQNQPTGKKFTSFTLSSVSKKIDLLSEQQKTNPTKRFASFENDDESPVKKIKDEKIAEEEKSDIDIGVTKTFGKK